MPSAFSLTEFANSAFRSALAAWAKAQSGSEASKRFSAVVLVEAYGWISIGVQAAAFQADLAREIMTPSLEALRTANELTEREALLQSGLTGENRRLLESKDMFPRVFCDRFPHEFGELPEAPTLFSLWCAESRAFAESSGKFVETLNFAHDKDWDIASGRLKDEYFRPEVDNDSEASLFEGYLRSLQHMNRISDLMGVEGARAAGWPARAIMRLRLEIFMDGGSTSRAMCLHRGSMKSRKS